MVGAGVHTQEGEDTGGERGEGIGGSGDRGFIKIIGRAFIALISRDLRFGIGGIAEPIWFDDSVIFIVGVGLFFFAAVGGVTISHRIWWVGTSDAVVSATGSRSRDLTTGGATTKTTVDIVKIVTAKLGARALERKSVTVIAVLTAAKPRARARDDQHQKAGAGEAGGERDTRGEREGGEGEEGRARRGRQRSVR